MPTPLPVSKMRPRGRGPRPCDMLPAAVHVEVRFRQMGRIMQLAGRGEDDKVSMRGVIDGRVRGVKHYRKREGPMRRCKGEFKVNHPDSQGYLEADA